MAIQTAKDTPFSEPPLTNLRNFRDVITDGLGFQELKQRALINPVARATTAPEDFSRLNRESRPGF